VTRAISPLNFYFRIFLGYLTFCFLQRLFYYLWVTFDSKPSAVGVSTAVIKGIGFDVVSSAFLFLMLALALALVPTKFLRSKLGHVGITLLTSLPLLLVFFMSLAEIFFFAEFHSRFNFIAVDYLVYSHEVIRNAVESYPLHWIFSGLLLVWGLFLYWIYRKSSCLQYQSHSLASRILVASVAAAPLAPLAWIGEDSLIANEPYWTRELSKNTLFTLFAAYNRNAISFHEFYTTLNSTNAHHIAHEWLEEEEGEELNHLEADTEDETSIIRNISAPGSQKNWNVVLVIIESLSARYMGQYGNTNGLTPNLDRLANEGVFFNQLYATGTRTVRGLEAIMMSIPPTPGQSILRRPKSDDVFNLGAVFRQKNYHTQFLYGGYSYFDNMKEWFQSNGFEIIDRSTFPPAEIQFANAWGICDEDLFYQVLKQGDRLHEEGRPFFQAILTTSNHRPYTYPDGRTDIPSHTGRSGAVKYTDYAIGQFIEKAKTKKWFNNTLFIFVADHDASVAGGSDIPIEDFLIPMIFYNPTLVSPQKITKLGSQIDLAPTLLGLMSFSYQSRFFGQDLFEAKAGRAVMGTYQKVALMEPGQLTILAPGHVVEIQILNDQGRVVSSRSVVTRDASSLPESAQRAVGIYQTASELFESGDSKVSRHFPTSINIRGF